MLFQVNYRPDITTTHVIRYNGVLYDITGAVENTGDFISLEEICTDELLWVRLQRDCIDLGVGME